MFPKYQLFTKECQGKGNPNIRDATYPEDGNTPYVIVNCCLGTRQGSEGKGTIWLFEVR